MRFLRTGHGDMQLARCSAKPRLGHRWLRHRRELLLGDRHSPSWYGLMASSPCLVVSMLGVLLQPVVQAFRCFFRVAPYTTQHAERLHTAGIVVASAVPFKAGLTHVTCNSQELFLPLNSGRLGLFLFVPGSSKTEPPLLPRGMVACRMCLMHVGRMMLHDAG